MSCVPSILLVGHESATRSTIADRLRECGFRVVCAAGFQEATTLLGSRAVAVDLVFSDAHLMDERDGLELARWARAMCPGLPVILTTGAAQTADLCDQLDALGPIETELAHVNRPSSAEPEPDTIAATHVLAA